MDYFFKRGKDTFEDKMSKLACLCPEIKHMDLVIDKLNFAKEAKIEIFMDSATGQYATKKGDWNISFLKHIWLWLSRGQPRPLGGRHRAIPLICPRSLSQASRAPMPGPRVLMPGPRVPMAGSQVPMPGSQGTWGIRQHLMACLIVSYGHP